MKKVFLLLSLFLSLTLSAWERETIWPKGKMPDRQDHQIAAMTDEVKGEKFKPDEAKTSEMVRVVKKFLEEHYKEDISLQDVADVLGYSDVYFCKIFKQSFGKSFIVYLNEMRIAKAKEALANPFINIKNVSTEAGYREQNYFARVFKRMTGMTPTEYRNECMARGHM